MHKLHKHMYTHIHTGKHNMLFFFFFFSKAFSYTQTVFPNQAALASPQLHNSASKQTPSSSFLLFPFLCLQEAKTKNPQTGIDKLLTACYTQFLLCLFLLSSFFLSFVTSFISPIFETLMLLYANQALLY